MVSGVALLRGGEARAATAVTGSPSARSTKPRSTGTWRPASGATGPAATRSRGARARSSSAIDGDYLNVVGLPVATLLDLWPGLLELAR